MWGRSCFTKCPPPCPPSPSCRMPAGRPARCCKECGCATKKGQRRVSSLDGFTRCKKCAINTGRVAEQAAQAAAELLAAQALKAEADERQANMEAGNKKFVREETKKRRKLEAAIVGRMEATGEYHLEGRPSFVSSFHTSIWSSPRYPLSFCVSCSAPPPPIPPVFTTQEKTWRYTATMSPSALWPRNVPGGKRQRSFIILIYSSPHVLPSFPPFFLHSLSSFLPSFICSRTLLALTLYLFTHLNVCAPPPPPLCTLTLTLHWFIRFYVFTHFLFSNFLCSRGASSAFVVPPPPSSC